jgi:hypothetical protein
MSRRFTVFPFRVYRALHSHGIYGDASAYNSRLSTAHKARVALGGNTTITVDDDFSQSEMILGLAHQAVQQAFKTEVQKLDEDLGNDYKANQHVYHAMIAKMNREAREDEEGY